MRIGYVGCVLAGVAAVAGLAMAPSAGAAAPAGHGRQARGPRTATPSPLVDHGGKILTASDTYAIFWGPTQDFPSDAEAELPVLLQGFGGSTYLAIANQYMRGATATSTYKTAFVDTSAPPAHGPSTSAIVAEVAKFAGTTPDPNGIYFVFTSNFPNVNYCAWHAAGTIGSTTVQVAYMPNTAGVAGCDPGNLYNANTLTEGTRSVADSTAHEYMEATTDPVPLSGWADKSGQEIGDKCNFVYSGPVTLSNHTTWQLQEEWSNAAGGCVQQLTTR